MTALTVSQPLYSLGKISLIKVVAFIGDVGLVGVVQESLQHGPDNNLELSTRSYPSNVSQSLHRPPH